MNLRRPFGRLQACGAAARRSTKWPSALLASAHFANVLRVMFTISCSSGIL